MRTSRNLIVHDLYGPAGPQQAQRTGPSRHTTFGPKNWGHGKKTDGTLRPTCAAHKLADWLYTNMSPWWRPHWRLGLRFRAKTAYDLWMSECLYAFNRRAYAPTVPSNSGGFTYSQAIPGAFICPPTEMMPWPSQQTTGSLWCHRFLPALPLDKLYVLCDLKDEFPPGPPTYILHLRTNWYAPDSRFEVDVDLTINKISDGWYHFNAGPHYLDVNRDYWLTLRHHTTDVTWNATELRTFVLPNTWPDPVTDSAGLHLRRNPYGTTMSQFPRDLGNWTPSIDLHSETILQPSGLRQILLVCTTPPDQRLNLTQRTLCLAVAAYHDDIPNAPTISVRITEPRQTIGPFTCSPNGTPHLYWTGNLDGLAAYGNADLDQVQVLDFRSHVITPP